MKEQFILDTTNIEISHINPSQMASSYLSSSSQCELILCVCSVPQLCLTLCSSMYCSPLDSFVPGIFQARMLEWVAISYSRGSSWFRDQTHVSCISCIGRQILYLREMQFNSSVRWYYAPSDLETHLPVSNLFALSHYPRGSPCKNTGVGFHFLPQ